MRALAFPGVVMERYTDRDGPNVVIAGVVEGRTLHRYGIPHATSQVAVVFSGRTTPPGDGRKLEPLILLYKRSSAQSHWGRWDISGGHVSGKGVWEDPRAWNDKTLIDELFLNTAREKVTDDLQIRGAATDYSSKDLIRFGGVADFDYGFDDDAAKNREYSTLYGLFIPNAHVDATDCQKALGQIAVVTDTKTKETSPECILLRLGDLLNAFSANERDFADGVARVLRRLAQQPRTKDAFARFLDDNVR